MNEQTAKKTIGIAGGGVMGRVLGWQLAKRGHQVTLFEKDGPDAENSAAYASAGMIAPSCEMESAEASVAHLGHLSLAKWEALSLEWRVESVKDFELDDATTTIDVTPKGSDPHLIYALSPRPDEKATLAVEYKVECDAWTSTEIQVDYGDGFKSFEGGKQNVAGDRRDNRFFVPLPLDAKGRALLRLRIDPVNRATPFKLEGLRLLRKSKS